MELVVRGGTVVTAGGTMRADVGVQDGRIVAIGDVPHAAREIDATGTLVLPGCVDLHTHLASTPTFTPLDDFEHGTRAAIAGGVTTVCSMVYQEGTLRSGVERGLRDAAMSFADFAFHIVVTDPSDAIAALAEAKARGLRVYGETRPLYLYLTRDRFERPDAALWVGQPPLREREDVDAMWDALRSGLLDTVGTDHYPHSRAAKLAPELAFDRVPPGVANLETLLPMLYSEGVRHGRLTLERMVDVLATSPARIAGLGGKGEIAVGRDADMVVFDPEETRTIRASQMHSACDYDPYEGWVVTGWPRLTLLRGEVVYARGEILARPGAGRLVARAALTESSS